MSPVIDVRTVPLMLRLRWSVALALLTVTLGAYAQQRKQDTAPEPSQRFPAEWYPPADPLATIAAPVIGKPFIATLTYTSRTTNQATGKVINPTIQTLKARDSSGRVREGEEQPYPGHDGKVVKVNLITVTDPVSHCTFKWSEPWIVPPELDHGPTANVTCHPRVTKLADGDDYAKLVAEPEGTTKQFDQLRRVEKLSLVAEGALTLQGVRVTVTSTLPDGKEQHVVSVIQYSPELQQMIRQTFDWSDQLNANTSSWEMHLTDIHREEPDSKLFYPPDGYRIESVQPAPPSAHDQPGF